MNFKFAYQQIEKIAALYKKVLPLREIGVREGLSKTTIICLLLRSKVPLRPMRNEARLAFRGYCGKMNAKTPYGFCYFEGHVTRHPKEHPVILNIMRRWKSGQSANSIATLLNGKGSRVFH